MVNAQKGWRAADNVAELLLVLNTLAPTHELA